MQLEMPILGAEQEAGQRVSVNAGAIAYVALFALALVLRLAELDTTPMMPSETHNALAAWRVIMSNAPGDPLIATSPIVFALQSVSFSLFGGSEIAARLATALAGAALVVLPMLFRSLIGTTQALLVSLLLTFSPVLLVASRTSSPDLWAVVFAVLGLWTLARAQAGESRYGVAAVVLFAAGLFLSGAGGVALTAILVVAGVVTWLWRRNSLVMNEDDNSANPGNPLRESMNMGLPLAALVVLAVATGLMLYPAGLSAVGESIGGAIRAVVQPQGISGYATLVSLFYEPYIWVLALVGFAVRREHFRAIDIFLAAWLVLAVVVSLFFGDSSPDHGLWMSVPLVGLASNALSWALATGRRRVSDPDVPRWARWLIAGCTIGVLAVFTLAFQSMARALLEAPQGGLTLFSPQPQSIVLLLVSVMFLVIGFFLFASLWGGRTSWQGILLGLALFGMFTSLGRGWSAAVFNAESPVEFWHTEATHDDTAFLSVTLKDVTERLSKGFPLMPIAVIAPQDGEIAWLLREFERARYISTIDEAFGEAVILAPKLVDSTVLEADYIGQDFIVSRSWDASTMTVSDFPAWWTQQRTRVSWTGADEVVLWLRSDVYQGTDQVAG